MLNLLILLFAIDYYYFSCWKEQIENIKNKAVKIFLYSVHFVPFILLFCFLLGLSFIHIGEWHPFIRTYLIGIIVLWMAPRVVMAVMYGIFALLRIIFRSEAFRANIDYVKHIAVECIGVLVLLVLIYGTVVTVFDLRLDMLNIRHTMEMESGIRPPKNITEEICNEAAARVPRGLRDYRIVQISDFHIGSFVNAHFIERVVDQILVLKPDLVVFTGDMINFTSSELDANIDILSQLKARDGVYAIMGNHDYGDYVSWPSEEEKDANLARLESAYEKMGWTLLNNNSLWIRRYEDSLRLVGVENWGKGMRFHKRGDIDKALSFTAHRMDSVSVKGFKRENYSHIYTVLLSHDPSHFDSVVYTNYPQIDLTLSGHTHGMQIGKKINDKVYTPAYWLYSHNAGIYTMPNGQRLYVNTGLGFNGLPFRLGIQPRITLIEL